MKPDKKLKEVKVKHTQVGALQSTDRAIDQTPIYYFAFTKAVPANTIVRWDAGGLVLESITQVK